MVFVNFAMGQSMWVFIKGISDDCSARDLTKLVCRLTSSRWHLFSNKLCASGIERSKVLKSIYKKSSQWEYHGLVYINPSESAHVMVGRLNANSKKGKNLQAHPYIQRQLLRDRRKLLLDHAVPFPGDRRREDRRRVSLACQVIDSSSWAGLQGFPGEREKFTD